MIYRHYGCTADQFRTDYIYEGAGAYKPRGFWACPEHAIDDWKDWCEGECYHEERLGLYFDFSLSPEARILKITYPGDIIPYCKWDGIKRSSYTAKELESIRRVDPTFDQNLDIEKLMANFDGLEIGMSENWARLHCSKLFYSYDVTSIVIWNLGIVVPFKEETKRSV